MKQACFSPPNRIIMGCRVVYGYCSHLDLPTICCWHKPQPPSSRRSGCVLFPQCAEANTSINVKKYLTVSGRSSSATPTTVWTASSERLSSPGVQINWICFSIKSSSLFPTKCLRPFKVSNTNVFIQFYWQKKKTVLIISNHFFHDKIQSFFTILLNLVRKHSLVRSNCSWLTTQRLSAQFSWTETIRSSSFLTNKKTWSRDSWRSQDLKYNISKIHKSSTISCAWRYYCEH